MCVYIYIYIKIYKQEQLKETIGSYTEARGKLGRALARG